ncbi:hypothetical protein QP157_20095 [Sphingomonas sp. LR61]
MRPGGCGSGGHRLGLFDGVRERLLAQDVLAGLERGDRDLDVRRSGRHDVDDVDVRVGHDGAPVGRRSLPAVLHASGLGAFRVAPDDHRHLGFDPEVEEPGGGPPRL